MNTKTLVVTIIVLILLGLAFYFMNGRENGDAYTATTTDATSPFRVEENAVVVSEHAPDGVTVVASTVYLSAPGFAVVHEEDGSAPGTIIGESALLAIGENLNVEIPLMRAMRDGERMYVMLHADTNGDGVFDAATDAPIQSILGGPIMGMFEVRDDAATSTPVTI